MSFGVSPEQSRPYDVRTTQPFTCIYSKEINENIGCSQILFIYIHALTILSMPFRGLLTLQFFRQDE